MSNSPPTDDGKGSGFLTTKLFNTCVEAGAIGALGAVPGTLGAHGFDVVKVRQQLKSESFLQACTKIYNKESIPSVRNFLAGSFPAIQQKVVTRAPMFLLSAASVHFFEVTLLFSPVPAAFFGSAVSGYATGYLASPWEWRKVLLSQRINSPSASKGVLGLFGEAVRSHRWQQGLMSVGRRFHAAGARNAIFDSTFFGVKRVLESTAGTRDTRASVASMISAYSYGIAALSAVVFDYAVDVSVKRLYSTGPEAPIPRYGVLRQTATICLNQGVLLFRGLGAKCAEFGISYAVTGMMVPYVLLGVRYFLSECK